MDLLGLGSSRDSMGYRSQTLEEGRGIVDVRIGEAEPGSGTRFANGRSIVDTPAILAIVKEDRRIRQAEVHLVKPGDDIRLVHVLDVVQPVARMGGRNQNLFPGILSPPGDIGLGPVMRINGLKVTVLGVVPVVDSFFTQQEGILEMAGRGAELSPLSRDPHVVLDLAVDPGTGPMAAAEAYRNAALRVARHIGESAGGGAHREVTLPDTAPAAAATSHRGRPLRLIHICEVSAFGSLFDTLIVGRSARDLLPTIVSPRAMAAGAVVSADYHYAGQRNYTCYYQSNPVEAAVAGAVPGGFEFLGTVVLPVGGDDTKKRTGAAFAAHIAELSGAEGAVVTAVAGGNAHLDVMFAVRECERRGIPTVLSIVEMAGPTGSDPGMVDTVPEADLMVSTGNREELVLLPPPGSVLGGTNLLDGPPEEGGGNSAAGELRVPLRTIVGSNNQMGAWRIGATLS